MIGIGPIRSSTESHFLEEAGDPAKAQIMAIHEYLEFNLDFNSEELSKLKIKDTKRASKDDVIYFTVEDLSQIKEIHYRKAMSKNYDLIVREFNPPQYHAWYMAIARRAAHRRAEDKLLKTQIHWGVKDIEIFTKEKGTKDQFRKEDLKAFMGTEELPKFDTKLQWKVRKEGKPRRELNFYKSKSALPSTRQGGKVTQTIAQYEKQGLVSTNLRKDGAKKMRAESSESDTNEDEEKMEDSTDSTEAPDVEESL